jgi:hypothetical protein
MQKRWEKKQNTYKNYEKALKEAFIKVFEKQEKDIMKEFENSKSYSNKALKLKLDKKYYAVYQLFLKDTIEEIVKSEGDRAMDEIEQEKAFQYNAEVAKKVKNMLTVTAKEVDSVTDSNLLKAIGKATNE